MCNLSLGRKDLSRKVVAFAVNGLKNSRRFGEIFKPAVSFYESLSNRFFRKLEQLVHLTTISSI